MIIDCNVNQLTVLCSCCWLFAYTAAHTLHLLTLQTCDTPEKIKQFIFYFKRIKFTIYDLAILKNVRCSYFIFCFKNKNQMLPRSLFTLHLSPSFQGVSQDILPLQS